MTDQVNGPDGLSFGCCLSFNWDGRKNWICPTFQSVVQVMILKLSQIYLKSKLSTLKSFTDLSVIFVILTKLFLVNDCIFNSCF